jgi:hypothetical protein
MPIDRLFRDGKIKAEEVERLNRAFTFALDRLNLVDRNDPLVLTTRKRFPGSQPNSLASRKSASAAPRTS